MAGLANIFFGLPWKDCQIFQRRDKVGFKELGLIKFKDNLGKGGRKVFKIG